MSKTNPDLEEYQLAEDANICTQENDSTRVVEDANICTQENDSTRVVEDKVSYTNQYFQKQYIRYHNCIMIFIYKGRYRRT
jgi:hypothetical protein